MNIVQPALAGAIALALLAAAAPGYPQDHSAPSAHQRHFSAPPPEIVYSGNEAVPFELFRGQRIIVNGAINGVPTEMMVDNGAMTTVISREFADRFGVKGDESISVRGVGGVTQGSRASNVSIEVAGLKINNATVLILDMARIARSIGRPIPVILGHEAFAAGPVTIDFPKRRIRFLPATAFVAPAAAIKVPLVKRGRLSAVKLSVAGLEPIEATLDIGNGGTLILANDYWRNQPVLAKLRTARWEVGGVGGHRPALRTTLPKVDFGGEQLTDVPAIFIDGPDTLPLRGANIGIEMLTAFEVTIDYAKEALYLVKGGESVGFARDRSGMRMEHVSGKLKVTFVSPEGPAAVSGLKPGDEIVAIDGDVVTAQYFRSPKADWSTGTAGKSVKLTRSDGSTVGLKLADYY